MGQKDYWVVMGVSLVSDFVTYENCLWRFVCLCICEAAEPKRRKALEAMVRELKCKDYPYPYYTT